MIFHLPSNQVRFVDFWESMELGKSTLMKILYGLESQSAGEILFDGKTSIEIKDDKKFGALIESPAIYMNLSAFDNLKTKALLYDIPDETIRETLNLIGLANTGRKKAGKIFFRNEATFRTWYGNHYQSRISDFR